MPLPVRLYDRVLQRPVIVDLHTKTVLQDYDDDNRIDPYDTAHGEGASAALRAAKELHDLYEVAVPGTELGGGRFQALGVLNTAEASKLDDGAAVPARRTPLQVHLDFFDGPVPDGRMRFGENYAGWRALGYGRLGAAVKATASNVLFGTDIEKVGSRRPKNSTGIFDAQGQVDEARLEEFLVEFDRRGENGALTPAQLKALIQEKSDAGRVTRGQYGSLIELCTRMNGEPKVTREQFRAFFEGSLLYKAASMTNNRGHRGLGQR